MSNNDTKWKQNFAWRLRKMMIKKGMNQMELADALECTRDELAYLLSYD